MQHCANKGIMQAGFFLFFLCNVIVLALGCVCLGKGGGVVVQVFEDACIVGKRDEDNYES